MKRSTNLKYNFNVPNILSVLRIFLIFPFVTAVFKDNYIFAGIILVISGLSDLLDGLIARKFNQITPLGKMLDPAADKLTLMAVMVCVGFKFPKIFPFMVILVIKEVLMLSAGALILKNKKSLPSAKWYGKIATVIFYISVITIIGLKAIWNIDNELVNLSLMTLTAIFMIYAIMRYFRIFVYIMRNKENNL